MSDFLVHPFEPCFDSRSKILILGSFPSAASRENGFYYGHPRNRFWPLMAALFECETPRTIDEKKALLLSRGAALWDSAKSLDIVGSSDASIKNAEPNDVASLLKKTRITRIFANGKTAAAIYKRHIEPETGLPVTVLPSTSPANAAFSFERLLEAWRVILD